MNVQFSSCIVGSNHGKLDDATLLVEHGAVGGASLQPVNANRKLMQGVTPLSYQSFSYRAILHRRPFNAEV